MLKCFFSKFSKKAILQTIRLMQRFNRTLDQQITIYETTKNCLPLSGVLNSIGPELFRFTDNFPIWSHNIKTDKDRKVLYLLEKQLEDAQSLVQTARTLIEKSEQTC